ncbi:MAG: VacJ family lipoprotein [Pseudomonadota bacterium]
MKPRFSFSVFPAVALLLSACATPDTPTEVFDPYEQTNRQVHEFNVGLDRALVRPTSNAYGTVIPQPVRRSVSNFANNLDTPRFVVNDVLQGNILDAGHNTMRFLVNSTLGLAGLFDPATSFGLETRRTGFGETLFVWGNEEGAYVELPVFGPSNQRDAVGTVVDLVSNPISPIFGSGERWIPPTANVADRLGARYEFSDTVDGLLYESADSYTAARSLYLQNRRFELTGGVDDEFAFDPFEGFDDE